MDGRLQWHHFAPRTLPGKWSNFYAFSRILLLEEFCFLRSNYIFQVQHLFAKCVRNVNFGSYAPNISNASMFRSLLSAYSICSYV